MDGDLIPLTPVKQAGGKIVTAWAVKGDFDPSTLRGNTFTIEWPPRSGKMREFPEVDRARWFRTADAREHIIKGQAPLIDELVRSLWSAGASAPLSDRAV